MMYFVSVCYYYKDLQEKCLHTNYCVWITSLIRSIQREIIYLAVVKYPWNQTIETPKPKGVPSHVLHMVGMEKLSNELNHLNTNMMAEHKKEMDARGFYSQEHSMNKIIDLITDATAKQTEMIFNQLKESTSLRNKLTTEAIARTASEYSDFAMIEEEDMMEELPKNASEDKVQLSHQNRLINSVQSLSKRNYRVGPMNVTFYGRKTCKFRVLPPSYKFPTMTSPQLIESKPISPHSVP